MLVGLGVRVGGTSEKGVAVKIGVHVGTGVLVGVISNVGLGVHVGSSFIGAGVIVGVLASGPVGGRMFSDEFGSIKINAKYPAMQAVSTKTPIERISQTPMEDRDFLIYITPLARLLR